MHNIGNVYNTTHWWVIPLLGPIKQTVQIFTGIWWVLIKVHPDCVFWSLFFPLDQFLDGSPLSQIIDQPYFCQTYKRK